MPQPDHLKLPFAEHTFEYLARVGGSERFDTSEHRKQFILGLQPDAHDAWLTRLNALAKDTTEHVRGPSSKTEGTLLMTGVDPEDQRPVLDAMLDASKRILTADGKVEQKLLDVSLLYAGGINFLHRFDDGNGRLSRLTSYLIRNGMQEGLTRDEFGEIIAGSRGPDQMLYTNPRAISDFLDEATMRKFRVQGVAEWPVRIMPKGHDYLQGLPVDCRQKASEVMEDTSFGTWATSMVMLTGGLQPDDYVNPKRGHYPDGSEHWAGYVNVQGDNYFAKFSPDDVQRADDLSRQMRVERVLTFVDAIEHPEDYPIQLQSEHWSRGDKVKEQYRQTTIRDYYAEFINHESLLYRREDTAKLLSGAVLLN